MEDLSKENPKSQGFQESEQNGSEQNGSEQTDSDSDKKLTLKEKIDKRKRDNQIAQIESDNQKELSDNLKKDFDELDKLFNEIDTFMPSYKEAYDNLKSQKECIKGAYDSSINEIKTEISEDEIEKIDEEVLNIKDRNKLLKKYIPKLLGECSDYKCSTEIPELIFDYSKEEPETLANFGTDESEEKVKIDSKIVEKYFKCAEENHETKQKIFDDLKNRKKTIEENFKKIDELKKKKDEESKKGNKYNEYFYIKKIGDVLDDTDILPPDDMKIKLEDALGILADAKRDLRMKIYVKNKFKDTLDAIGKNLEDAEKNFDKECLEKISRIQ